AHQRQRQCDTRRAAQRGDAPPWLDRGADRTGIRPEQLRCLVEIVHQDREAPEARRTVGSPRALDRLVRLLDQLEDLGAEAEERLTWRAGGGWLLANPAQIQARALQCTDAAVKRRGHRHDVVDRDDAVRVGGCEDLLRSCRDARRKPVELYADDVA